MDPKVTVMPNRRTTPSLALAILLAITPMVIAEPKEESVPKPAIAASTSSQKESDSSQKESEPRFLRMLRRENKTPLALQTAIVRFVPADAPHSGVSVDLISAVHVAEKSYYSQLNRRFREYDLVLYELVAPEGTRIPKGGVGTSTHPVSLLQTAMTGMLNLEFQLNAVDYTRKNFVHADMSPEQFAESMRKRGESMFQIFFRMMGYALSQQTNSSGGDVALLVALFSKDRALAMKRVLAEQFEDLEGSLNAINGPDGSTLITERNKVALAGLRKQLDAGHKKLAIFYGAAHMPDFQKRLRDDFGLTPSATTWLVAWDLQGKPKPQTKAKVSPPRPL